MNLVQITHRLEITFWNAFIDILNDPRSLRVISVFLVVGLLFGLVFFTFGLFVRQPSLMKSPEVQAPSPASIVVSSPAENITPRQFNTLVILVDDISASAKKNPQNVKGVWLTAYLPSQTKLMLMPLYTIEDINTETIQNQFRLGGKGAPSREFFKAVRKFDVTWDYYVLIETVIFEELFDRANAENIEWNGHPELLWSVTHQAMLANEICKLAGDFTQSTDRRPIYDGFEGYYITDFDTERLLELWKQNQGLGSRLTCEFPTLRDVLPITHAAH